MISKLFKPKFILALLLVTSLSACGGKMGADARKVSPDPKARVKKILKRVKVLDLTI